MSYHKCFCRDAAVLLIIGQQQFTPRCILNNPFAAGPHVELPQGSGRRSDDAKPLALRLGETCSRADYVTGVAAGDNILYANVGNKPREERGTRPGRSREERGTRPGR
jgi:hypothetical protein